MHLQRLCVVGLPAPARVLVAATFLALFLLLPAHSIAQTLLPFDAQGSVYFVSSEFEGRTGFLGIAGLREAWIELAPDSSLALVATVADATGYRVVRRVMTEDDLGTLRRRYAQLGPDVTARPVDVQDDGRNIFIQTFAGLGLSWYGLTIPAVAELDGPGAIGTYLLTAGACYFFADGHAADMTITRAQGFAFQYGATRGILHGYALMGIISGSDLDHRIAIPVSTLISIIEGFGAMKMSRSAGWTEGQTSAIGVAGDAGILLGFTSGYLTGAGGTDILRDLERNPRRYSSTVILSSIAGLTAGAMLTRWIDYAPGDASIQEAIGYLGAAAGYTLADAVKERTHTTLYTGLTIGLLGGHVVGALAADAHNISVDDAQRVRLLTSGGIVIGLGVVYIIAGDEGSRTAFLSAATLGGALGMWYGLGRAGEAPRTGTRGGSTFGFYPGGMLRPHSHIPFTGLIRNNPFAVLTLRF